MDMAGEEGEGGKQLTKGKGGRRRKKEDGQREYFWNRKGDEVKSGEKKEERGRIVEQGRPERRRGDGRRAITRIVRQGG